MKTITKTNPRRGKSAPRHFAGISVNKPPQSPKHCVYLLVLTISADHCIDNLRQKVTRPAPVANSGKNILMGNSSCVKPTRGS
jgi:hypothetical protein